MEQFIVSARKYRPATFDMVVGQTAITSTLKNAIRNNILAQAFLFTGPRGVGKTTCARIMAKTINCLNPSPEMEACDKCESCVSFRNSASFNIHELDAASNNSVDDIRALVDQVRIPPQVGKYKIYIIDEVHMLSSAAFNAFLKTLEEPPSYAKFILATTEKHKIIPTILSRCQIFDFKRITVDDIVQHLHYVAQKENVEAEHDALNIIAQKADGALRDALSIFDQMVSFSGSSISYKNVIDNLNVLDYDYYFSMTADMLQSNTTGVLLRLNEIIDNGFDGQHFVTGLGSHLRNLLVSKDPATTSLLETSQSLRDRYANQAAFCNSAFLLKALEIQNQCDLNYARSSSKRLLVEIAMLQICGITKPAPSDDHKTPAPLAAAPATPQVNVAAPSVPVAKSTAPANVAHAVQATPNPAPLIRSNPTGSATVIQKENVAQAVVKPKTGMFSINAALEAAEKKDEVPVVLESSFSKTDLNHFWNSFAQTHKESSPSFALALLKYEPEISSDYVIRFKVDNNLLLADKLKMNALLDFLKNNLSNTLITLDPVLVEAPVDKEAYTDREKFEKMAAHRPMLRLFKDELGLEAEI
ncbi:MAG: DNA polymerase III subunit gamma/tau [Bacteroidetes bacterium]|nr:MAG: DNA polymerase III subunit gamma/tau [Bacteroidota bacterium]